MKGAISLVIFDCDGVLVDSEPISNRVLSEAITEAGLPTTCEEAKASFSGHRLAEIVTSIETRLGKPLPDQWLAQFEERRAEAFRRELKEVSGASRAVPAIRASGLSICVASQARLEKSLLTLKLVGLLEYFEGNIFSASMVERGKPYPDLFLYAAGKMGHAPERCAVVEDSVLGINAARAARMRAFGYAGAGNACALRSAGAHVFREMRVLPGLLAGIS
jgi:HAD superfamily hydrolase (TIGR01509 family)